MRQVSFDFGWDVREVTIHGEAKMSSVCWFLIKKWRHLRLLKFLIFGSSSGCTWPKLKHLFQVGSPLKIPSKNLLLKDSILLPIKPPEVRQHYSGKALAHIGDTQRASENSTFFHLGPNLGEGSPRLGFLKISYPGSFSGLSTTSQNGSTRYLKEKGFYW